MSFIKNTVWNTADRLATAFFGFLIVMMVSSSLGPEGQGSVTFFRTVWATAYSFGSFGLELSINYFVARLDHKDVRKLVANAIFLGLVMPILPLAIMIGLNHYTDYFVQIETSFHLLLLGVVFFFVSRYLRGILYGKAAFSVNFIGNMLEYAVIISAFLYGFRQDWFSVEFIMRFWVLGQFCCLVFNLISVLIIAGLPKAGWSLLKQQALYGIKAYLLHILLVLNMRVDTYIVLYFLDLKALGIYSFGVLFSEIVLYIPNAITRVILTQVSSKGRLDLWVFPNISGVTLLIIVCGGLTFPVFTYLFFPEFKAAIPVFLIFLPANYFMGLAGAFSFYFMGRNRPEVAARASALSFVLMIGCNVILIPMMGIVGAALSSLISYGAYFFYQYFIIRHYDDVQLKPSLSYVWEKARAVLKKVLKRG